MSTAATDLATKITDTLTALARGHGYDGARLVQAPMLDLLPARWSDIERAAACDDLIRRFAPLIQQANHAAAVAAALNLDGEYHLPTVKARLLAFRRRWHQVPEHGKPKIDLADDVSTYDSTNQWWMAGKKKLRNLLAHEIARRNRAEDWPTPSSESLTRIAGQVPRAADVEAFPADAKPGNLTSPEPIPSRARPDYVHRETEETCFRQLVAEGSKLIVLHGLPGMGKTWLAQTFASQMHPQHVEAPLIRVVDGQIEIQDMQAALVTSGVKLQQSIADDPREYLAMLLYGDQAPLFTILDGLESADELNTLLPPGNARHVVLATCRDRGKAPPEHGRFLKVSEMEPEEATQMIRKRLPSLGEAEANQLAHSLHCYPLVIRYACALIDHQPISVAQFCHDIEIDPGIAGQIYTDHDHTLLTVLQRIVSLIAATDKGSLILLKVIASCTMRPAMDRNILWRYASAIYNGGQSLSPTRFGQAMDLLQRFSLIESRINPEYSPSENIVMHQLTRRLLKQEVVGTELGIVAANFVYLAMTYTQDTGMSKDLRLLPGDAGIEAVTTHLIMIAICGEVIIDNHPPGAMAKIAPELRPGVESYLAFWILQANDGLRKANFTWRLPQGWVEWSKGLMELLKTTDVE